MKPVKRLVYRTLASACISLLCVSPAAAQKKEIQAARDQVKLGKDLDKAQASMQKLLADSALRGNKKIWATYFESVRKQYEQGNEKLYLKQKYDTVQLFQLARQLFQIAQQLDSVEMTPDRKGRTEIEFRKPHAEYLSLIRKNLYNGGLWFVARQDYAKAYQFFDQYIACADQPLFGDYDYRQKDSRLPLAAYYAVYAGYKMQDPKATLHHSYEALKDTLHYDYMLQYLAETYKLEQDTARYVEALREGFGRAPKLSYFFPRLVEYYVERAQLDSAMAVVDQALTAAPDSDLYLATKANILLEQGRLGECAELSERLTQDSPQLPEPFYNAGICYFRQAVELDKNMQASRKERARTEELYRKALPYLRRYREMEPEAQAKWAFPLYTIYLNLNMGKEFDEIDKIIKGKK